MTDRPVLLDLFCGAGGAAVGYWRAGFDVVGVDLSPQPRYPFPFVQADALTFPLDGYAAIHASPPCQAYTSASNRHRGTGGPADLHPDLIAPTHARLQGSGVPWILENVPGASRAMLGFVIVLEGAMFGLGVHRPRLFESNMLIMRPGRGSHGDQKIGVYGKAPDGRTLNAASGQRAARSVAEGAAAMGVDWPMTWRELAESIPPAYTEWIGAQLLPGLIDRRGTVGEPWTPFPGRNTRPAPPTGGVNAPSTFRHCTDAKAVIRCSPPITYPEVSS